MLRATPAVPNQTFFRLQINTFVDGKNPFVFLPKDGALLHVD